MQVNTSYQYITRNVNDIATYQFRTVALKPSFFPRATIEWNRINIDIRSSSYSVFRSYLLKKIRPKTNHLCNICNSPWIKFLTWLKLGLSLLNEHKLNCNFDDFVIPFCNCSLELESGSRFFHCHHCNSIRMILL